MTDQIDPSDAYEGPPSYDAPPTPRLTYAQWQAEQDPTRRPGPTDTTGWHRQGLGYPVPVAPAKSVTGLGIATQILVAVQFVVAVIQLFPALHEKSLVNRILDDPGSVSRSDAESADRALNTVGAISVVLYLATAVVWIVWFYRIRRNVESWSPQHQRRGVGWAIGGWFCPIVNLWFPFIIARDVLDDTENDTVLPHSERRMRPLLVLWWFFLLATLLTRYVVGQLGRDDVLTSPGGARTYATGIVMQTVMTLVACVPAVLVVRMITAAQTARIGRAAGAVPASDPWGSSSLTG